MAEEGTDKPSSKVARLIDRYDLEGIGEELESRWTADGDRRLSLRDLADRFNRRLLEQTLLEVGMSTIEHDVDSIYRDLTDTDVSAGVRTDTRERLQRNGADLEQLDRNFVTYQAIRSYLKEWRGVEYEQPSTEEKIEKDQASIQRLQTRLEAITETRIENLGETERIDVDDFEVFATVQVLCQECGTQYDVDSFLEEGGCDCARREE